MGKFPHSCISILGVFIARGKEDALVTLNMVPGESVYGEKRIGVGVRYPHSGALMNSFCLREITDAIYIMNIRSW